jgi:hypothetical protein
MRIPTPVILVAGAIAWLTVKERNPMRWPDLIRREGRDVVRDAREALVDGAQAGVRAEKAFDDDLAEARQRARTW